jgi:hypothetical protein
VQDNLVLEPGFAVGQYHVANTDGSPIDVVYCALADVLPERHVVVFAPSEWPEDELGMIESDGMEPSAPLTPREVEILTLAGQSLTVHAIAES